jgi:hypothetical protein
MVKELDSWKITALVPVRWQSSTENFFLLLMRRGVLLGMPRMIKT